MQADIYYLLIKSYKLVTKVYKKRNDNNEKLTYTKARKIRQI